MSPGQLVNIVEFKTLGLLPGATQQPGDLKIIDGQRYQVRLRAQVCAQHLQAVALQQEDGAGVGGYPTRCQMPAAQLRSAAAPLHTATDDTRHPTEVEAAWLVGILGSSVSVLQESKLYHNELMLMSTHHI